MSERCLLRIDTLLCTELLTEELHVGCVELFEHGEIVLHVRGIPLLDNVA